MAKRRTYKRRSYGFDICLPIYSKDLDETEVYQELKSCGYSDQKVNQIMEQHNKVKRKLPEKHLFIYEIRESNHILA